MPWNFFFKKVIFEDFSLRISSKNRKKLQGSPLVKKIRWIFQKKILNQWYLFLSIPTVYGRSCTKNMWQKWEKSFFTTFFHKGGPLWFFQFFYEILNEKSSKMTFLKKKFQKIFHNFFFKFWIFGFKKIREKIIFPEKKFCVSSQNSFKLIIPKI